MNEPWRVVLLGGLRAEQGEQAITRFYTYKIGALFAFLAYHRQQAHPREVLIEMLWPDSDPKAGRASLSTALSSLRNQFEPPGTPPNSILRADRFSVGLNPAAITTDAAEFEEAIRAARRQAARRSVFSTSAARWTLTREGCCPATTRNGSRANRSGCPACSSTRWAGSFRCWKRRATWTRPLPTRARRLPSSRRARRGTVI
jgi:hypothetical protein